MKKTILAIFATFLLYGVAYAQYNNAPDIESITVKAMHVAKSTQYRVAWGDHCPVFDIDEKSPDVWVTIEVRTYASGLSKYRLKYFNDEECNMPLISVKEGSWFYRNGKVVKDVASHYFEIEEQVYIVQLE